MFLLLAVVFVFGQTVRHDFFNLDDNAYVYANPHVTSGFTVQGILWSFTHVHACYWIPLTWLSHMLDCQLYGLQHPGGHHLTNVLLHATSAIILFLVLRRMTGGFWRCAFVATVFAIHPLHVESVAWVAERKDVLSGLFFMLTLAAYAGYVQRPFSLLRYLLVTILFVLGLMAKPMLVTLPFVLLLLDYWPLGRLGAAVPQSSQPSSPTLRRVVLEKLPWLALAAGAGVVTLFAQQPALASTESLSFSSRVANASVAYIAYLGQFFYPVGLAVLYPHPQNSLPIWKIIGSLLLLVGISLGGLAGRRKYPYLLVGWLWYLGMLVPVIGLVQAGMQAMADRFTYLTQIGLYIALAWGTEYVSRKWPYRRWVVGVMATLAVVSLGYCARQQTSYWKDAETLWTHTLVCTTKNWLAHNNLGIVLASRGQVDAAIAHFKKALEITPDHVETHNNLGGALAIRGEVGAAIACYRKALEIQPDYAEAHNNLGVALAGRGQTDEAIVCYRKALEIQSDYVTAHNNLGNALRRLGRVDEAIVHFRRALAINPNYVAAHGNLGDALGAQGKLDEAIQHYRVVLQLNPQDIPGHLQLGKALAQQGSLPEAEVHFREALRLHPADAAACAYLAKALLQQGQTQAALRYYQEALRLQPDQPEALNDLAWLRATHPDPKLRNGSQAVTLARRACELATHDAEALDTLAAAYAEAGRFAEAAQTARQAMELATQQHKPALAESIQARIRLYEVGTPFREPAERASTPAQ